MTTAIVDYGSGNLRSAAKALERAGRDVRRPERVMVTADPDAVRAADRIVLPGVGAFGHCRDGLAAIPGMIAAIEEAVGPRARPFLGICVGMQLMAERGLEYRTTTGFGWIKGDVIEISPPDPALKVPHMGWNELHLAEARGHPLFRGVGEGAHVYFVHSYRVAAADRAEILATADYGGEIAAAIGRGNLVGTQFHPEKSQAVGLAILANFLGWRP